MNNFDARTIIWEGLAPHGSEQFRIVYCPDHQPPHPTHVLEIRKGHDALGHDRWGHVESGAYSAAMSALMAEVIRIIPEPLRQKARNEAQAALAYWQQDQYAAALCGKTN